MVVEESTPVVVFESSKAGDVLELLKALEHRGVSYDVLDGAVQIGMAAIVIDEVAHAYSVEVPSEQSEKAIGVVQELGLEDESALGLLSSQNEGSKAKKFKLAYGVFLAVIAIGVILAMVFSE